MYLLKRIAYGIAVMMCIVVLVSSIIFLAPVDPAQMTFGQRAEAETLENKRKELGLDKALHQQLALYLSDISPINFISTQSPKLSNYSYTKILGTGERMLIFKTPYLRESFQSGRKVNAILSEAIPKTLLLALASILLATIMGISLGVFASMQQNSWGDNIAVVCSVIGYSFPSYVTAILLALTFGYLLGDVTGLNVQGSIIELDEFGDKKLVLKNLILPAIALGIRPVAIITLLTRSSMLDVMKSAYMKTAKAKGLGKVKLVFKHALRNALNPVTTAITGWFAALLAGAFFVENVFNFKGLGDITVTALQQFDIPVVLGAVLFTALAFILVNILVDVLYRFLDPRIES